jgi:hypothetical protein
MEPITTKEALASNLELPVASKDSQFLKKTFFATYKIPLIFLILFGLFVLRVLMPETFSLGFEKPKNYRFQHEGMVSFVGDVNVFMNNSFDETEERVVGLFPGKMQKKVKRIIRPVLILCEKYQVDPFWVLSVMWAESSFQHEAISKKGARGLMQIMPPTYSEALADMRKKGIYLESDRGEDFLRYQYGQTFYDLGYPTLVSKLRHLEVGIYYLKGLFVDFNHNHYHATVSYNMGPNWTRSQLKNNLPIGENNRYLSKVLKNYFYITKTLTQNPNVTFIPHI